MEPIDATAEPFLWFNCCSCWAAFYALVFLRRFPESGRGFRCRTGCADLDSIVLASAAQNLDFEKSFRVNGTKQISTIRYWLYVLFVHLEGRGLVCRDSDVVGFENAFLPRFSSATLSSQTRSSPSTDDLVETKEATPGVSRLSYCIFYATYFVYTWYRRAYHKLKSAAFILSISRRSLVDTWPQDRTQFSSGTYPAGRPRNDRASIHSRRRSSLPLNCLFQHI